jgi:hypothetical protein
MSEENDNKLTITKNEVSDLVINLNPNPICDISFYGEHGEIGRLTFDNDQIHFTGNADESAKNFFGHVLKPMVDGYIAEKLKKEGNEPKDTTTDSGVPPDGN